MRRRLYVRGFLSGRKLFQVRLSVDSKRHWIDVGDYPQKSLAATREISLALKRVAKSRGASLEQIKRAALLATSASDFEANLNVAKVDTVERTGIPTFGEFFKQWYQLQISADRWTHKASINKPTKAYENHLEAKLGNLRIDKITRLDLKNVLQPIYLTNRKLGQLLRELRWRLSDQLHLIRSAVIYLTRQRFTTLSGNSRSAMSFGRKSQATGITRR